MKITSALIIAAFAAIGIIKSFFPDFIPEPEASYDEINFFLLIGGIGYSLARQNQKKWKLFLSSSCNTGTIFLQKNSTAFTMELYISNIETLISKLLFLNY